MPACRRTRSALTCLRFLALMGIACLSLFSHLSHAGPPFPEFVDPNPNPGNQFGAHVVPLSTGNVVITSPYDDAGGVDAGAVYLFNGATGALISTLRGSSANDYVGSDGVTALSNGNYVVCSPFWDNGAAADAGAVTWGSGSIGVSGVVSASNSLVGSTVNDQVGKRGAGSEGLTALNNGNYLVHSPWWDNGTATNAGAVTWGSGNNGVSGVVSSSNSLVGSSVNDQVGYEDMTVLSNSNYVVRSPIWDNGGVADAGAVTWGNGSTGVSGAVSSNNSLVGSTANDQVGSVSVTALSNGNYVVSSPDWDNGGMRNAGAVTWVSGISGVSGEVNASNSLVGSKANDSVGSGRVTALSNGNYVVGSPSWNNGGSGNAGAVTWGSGSNGVSGVVDSSNSLVGSSGLDVVSSGGVTALSNGNYVVSSPFWSNGAAANAGAVTWVSGISGVSGEVNASNSLVGSKANDSVGSGRVTALSNGNYVVSSPSWNNGGSANAGAVTWGSGSNGVSGVVDSTNSLVGSTASDRVGNEGVTALNNGNYVVISSTWGTGGAVNVGAVTWGSGSSGVTGVVSSSNSLVGSTTSDRVGSRGVMALGNGNYVVCTPLWTNGVAEAAGAVTWGSGSSGVSGVVSSSNSLVGSTAFDRVGNYGVTALTNGNYVVSSASWDNGTVVDAGAVTWSSGTSGVIGVVSRSNSHIGSKVSDLVGSSGVTALSDGNYVVSSSSWDNGALVNAGAVTWGSGSGGVRGVVRSSNSLVGLTSSTSLRNVVVDNVNGTFFGRFLSEGSGKVRVGSQGNDWIAPVILITGSDKLITNGDTMPDATDATDFGNVALFDSTNTHFFIIENGGYATLNLADPAVVISGPGADDFKVTTFPAAEVAADGQTTFAITFDPRVPGLRTATVTVASDDTVNASYNFAISGFGELSKPLAQTITFAPPTTVYLDQSPLNLSATASSGLPVTLSVVPTGTTAAGANLEGNVLSFTGIGKVQVQAVQAGGDNYAAAKTVVKTITVKANPTALTLVDLAQTYTGAPRAISTVGGNGEVTIEYKIGDTFGSTAPTDAGKYSVKATDDSGTKTGTLIIAKAPLYVTPDSKRKFAGEDNPELTAVYSGFLGDDSVDNITEPVLKTTAKTTSGGGLYPITASGGVAANYLFVYQQGTLVVESFGGSYEALLVDADDVPVGKLTLTVPLTGQSFSGKLMIVTETAALSLKGELTTDVEDELATGRTTVTKGAASYDVSFTLPMQGDVLATVTRDDEPLGSTETGRKLLALVKGSTVLYSGAHTAVLEPALPAAGDVPVGAGWAAASISKTGVMTLAGKLADGTAFTTSLAPDGEADPGYRLFVQPYKKRTESSLGGAFTLLAYPTLTNRRYVSEASLSWSKAGFAADASYREGFGPVTTVMMLDPWLPPIAAKGSTPAITLATRLGLTESALGVQHSDTGSTLNDKLPTLVTLSLKNEVSVQLPVTTPVNSTKWKTKLVTTTGLFTGSFDLADTGGKPRVVPFSGVLRQPAAEADALIGAGHYLLPALPVADSNEQLSGEVMFTRP